MQPRRPGQWLQKSIFTAFSDDLTYNKGATLLGIKDRSFLLYLYHWTVATRERDNTI